MGVGGRVDAVVGDEGLVGNRPVEAVYGRAGVARNVDLVHFVKPRVYGRGREGFRDFDVLEH